MNKKKALALLLLAAMMILCLSGCVLAKTAFEFNEDGSVAVTDGVYFSQEYFDLVEQTPEEFFAAQEEPVYDIKTVKANDTTYYGTETLTTFSSEGDIEVYKSMNEVPWDYYTYEEEGRKVGCLSYTISSDSTSIDGGEDAEDVDLSGIMLVKLEATFAGGIRTVVGASVDAYTIDGNTVSIEVTAAEDDFMLTIEGFLDKELEPIFEYVCMFDSLSVGRTLSSVDYYVNNMAPEPRACFSNVELHWFRRASDAPMEVDFEEISGDVLVEAGYQYALTIVTDIKEGYYYADNFHVTFNDLSSDDVPGLCSIDGKNVIIQYVFGEIAPKEETTPFTDVAKDAYYYDATVWAYNAKPQITDGNGADKFMPEQICTRGQVVTFLWRALGQPVPEKTENPFVDVKDTDYFYYPVLWAYHNPSQITDGTDATHFSPANPCKNSHILTFIYRAMGEPGKTGEGTWYTDAYNWANYKGLLKGTYEGTYDINAECPRKNVVQYLYTYFNMSK